MQTTEDSRSSTREQSPGRAIALLTIAPVVVSIVVVGVIAALSVPAALIVALPAVGGCVAWAVFARRVTAGTEDRIIGLLSAHEAFPETHARMHNVTEGLCLALGVSKPRIMSVETDAVIAGAVAGAQSAGCLFVSTGFTESMDRIEHEAVVAHLLVRLRSGDIAARSTRIAWADATSSLGVGGAIGSLLERSSTFQPLHEADIAACQVTRYPPGLVSALAKIADGPTVSEPGIRRTVDLWVADGPRGDAVGGPGVPSVGVVRLTVDERIDLLKEI